MFKVPVEVGDQSGSQWEMVEMWVDSGAFYSWVPGDVLERLGVRPEEQLEMELADRSRVQRDLGQASVRYDGRQHVTLVIFGDEGSEPLLGAYTLEGFRLAIDPVAQALVPIPFVHALGSRLRQRP